MDHIPTLPEAIGIVGILCVFFPLMAGIFACITHDIIDTEIVPSPYGSLFARTTLVASLFFTIICVRLLA